MSYKILNLNTVNITIRLCKFKYRLDLAAIFLSKIGKYFLQRRKARPAKRKANHFGSSLKTMSVFNTHLVAYSSIGFRSQVVYSV